MVVDQGLADEPVWSIFEDAEADIWVGGERSASTIANYDLRGVQPIEGAGHWVQQEEADEVNRLLIAFLDSL